MGIQGLHSFISGAISEAHLSTLKGQRCAVDGYAWLHGALRADALKLATGQPSHEFVARCMERIARLLLEHFGNLRELQDALADLNSFPKIRLDDRTCIGKTRLKMLARYLA